jgi:hypothetical protein
MLTVDVLPPLLVATARDVGVGQLVDEGEGRPAGQYGVEVHLVEGRPLVGEGVAGHHLEVSGLLLGAFPAVRLEHRDHDVGAPRGPAPPLVEHGEGLAHAGRGTEVDP